MVMGASTLDLIHVNITGTLVNSEMDMVDYEYLDLTTQQKFLEPTLLLMTKIDASHYNSQSIPNLKFKFSVGHSNC